MKKLLLTSSGLSSDNIAKRFLDLIGKNPNETRILFITTASTNEEEQEYVKKSEEELLKLGIIREHITWIKGLDSADTQEHDVMYVCGGNTYYLLHEIRRTHFNEKILHFIDSGGVYVGVSAGSIIMCPDIRHAKNLDKNFIKLQDTRGLNVIDKVIQPHYEEKDEDTTKKFEKENECTVLRLPDNQALEIADHKQKRII